MKSLSSELNFSFFMVILLLHSFVATSSFRVETYPRISVGIKGKEGPKFSERAHQGHEEEMGSEVYPTGSTIPDCTHACGACTPCKRVMVSFKCSVAESCPVVYRCTCNGKYYHVPSNA